VLKPLIDVLAQILLDIGIITIVLHRVKNRIMVKDYLLGINLQRMFPIITCFEGMPGIGLIGIIDIVVQNSVKWPLLMMLQVILL